MGSLLVGNDHLEMLRTILDAFNRHDLDEIMSHFAEDAVSETPRGPDPWGAGLPARRRCARD